MPQLISVQQLFSVVPVLICENTVITVFTVKTFEKTRILHFDPKCEENTESKKLPRNTRACLWRQQQEKARAYMKKAKTQKVRTVQELLRINRTVTILHSDLLLPHDTKIYLFNVWLVDGSQNFSLKSGW